MKIAEALTGRRRAYGSSRDYGFDGAVTIAKLWQCFRLCIVVDG
jgi:hypothetical protein